MPLDKTIRKVLVIGSGPIVIGQAAEFDYAGTQACRALREDGIEIVLLNSNPATIMTDKSMADKIYIEPLTLTTVKRIIETEKPDSILSGLGVPRKASLNPTALSSWDLHPSVSTRPKTVRCSRIRWRQ